MPCYYSISCNLSCFRERTVAGPACYPITPCPITALRLIIIPRTAPLSLQRTLWIPEVFEDAMGIPF
jgi:hypothetical protein